MRGELCTFCGVYPVQGWRPSSKFCSRVCSSKFRWQRIRKPTRKDDLDPHVIDALFERAKAAQKAKRWSA
jgi:hypothetical protein